MSQHALPGASHLRLSVPLRGRDPNEPGRASTPLELFFDLVVVVAVALAAERLHHALIDGFGIDTVVSYMLVFFGVWWAWANFSWFASAYDTDDVIYRLGTFVVMTGALVLAAGVPQVFDERNFTLAVIGYVIMRVALGVQWLRVSRDDPLHGATARRYAIGVAVCQLGWLSLLVVPGIWPIAWLVLVPAELLLPLWAQRAGRINFHNEHIAERYGLFMIIVLGESVLAASLAIQTVIGGESLTLELLSVIVGGLLILYSMWWIYFDRPEEHLLDSLAAAQAWNYLHLFIFASVAAVGAGLVVGIEEATGHAHVGWQWVGLTIAVPLVIFMVALTLLYVRLPMSLLHRAVVPVAAVLALVAAFMPMPVLTIGLVLAGTTGFKVWLRFHEHEQAKDEAVSSAEVSA
ncbi:MAG TPA: low temperature requirement protein A [Candidatus Limnocylindrales bacterium]|nr:low temperature requirement protein A [Candidatus Limnocylindrales bacterium]